MAFSGALTLTDLNDFITPAQACIKPVEQTNKPEQNDPGAASKTEIRVDSAGSYYEVATNGLTSANNPQKKLETAQISLNDCLACSGCITSAESVLITLQSHTEALNVLAQNPPITSVAHKVAVVSIAPQSLASLAASLSSSSTAAPVGLQQILQRVKVFCTTVLGFDHVYDTTFARHVALLEHVQEFKERKQGNGSLPMLASACPGWVCYAEKTHSEMLPFISRTKSPQQVMGTLVKEWLGKKWGKAPDQIYHVTVMPCYDKKLEASRQDFYNEVYGTRDVDCVITTGELELMMREKGWDLSIPVPGERHNEESEALRQRKSNNKHDVCGKPLSDSVDEGHSGKFSDPRETKTGQTQKASLLNGYGHDDVGNDDDVVGQIVGSRNEEQEVDGDSLSFNIPELINHPGSSSGSYLHSLISMMMSPEPSTFSLSSPFPYPPPNPPDTTDPNNKPNHGTSVPEHNGNSNIANLSNNNNDSRSGSGSSLELSVRTIRSADYEEYTLTERKTGTIIFRGAKCYGFRNLQNVVRKVGRDAGVQVGRGAAGKLAGGIRATRAGAGIRGKKLTDRGAGSEKGYDYVEVMACPGGCVNGGGQLRPPPVQPNSNLDEEGYKRDWEGQGVTLNVGTDGGRIEPPQGAKWGDKEWTKKVEAMYWDGLPTSSASLAPRDGRRQDPEGEEVVAANRLAAKALRDLCHPEEFTDRFAWDTEMDEKAEGRRRTLFRTQYRAVESEVVGLAVKW